MSLREAYRTHTRAIIICAVALLVRLAFLAFSYHYQGEALLYASNEDALGYLRMGASLVAGDGFMLDGIHTAIRTPVYPLFIAVFILLKLPLISIAVAHAILGALSVWVVYHLGSRIFSAQAGTAAALLYALEPYMVAATMVATTEVLFGTLMLLSVWYLVSYMTDDDKKYARLFLALFFLGLAALTRPVALYLSLLYPIFVAYYEHRRAKNSIRAVGISLLTLCIFAATVFPWSLRQYLTFGSWKLSNIDTYMLYTRILPLAIAERDATDYVTAARTLMEEELPRNIPNYDPLSMEHTFAYDSYLQSYATQEIRKRPFSVIRFYVYSLGSALFGSGYDYILQDFGMRRDAARISYTDALIARDYGALTSRFLRPSVFELAVMGGVLFWLAVYFAGIHYAWVRRLRISLPYLVLLMLTAYFIFFSLGPQSHARYRLPSYPWLFLLASPSLALWYERFRTKIRICAE